MILKRPRFIAENATFSDLKSAGNRQIVQDFALKKALFDYHRLHEAIDQVESAEREVTTSLIAPYTVKQLPLAVGATMPKPGELLRLLNEVEFRNNVLIRYVNRQELLGDYREMRALNGHVWARLKQEIR